VHERARCEVVARRATLDEVGRERERCTGEPDERRRAERCDREADRLGDGSERLRRERPGVVQAGSMTTSTPASRSGTTMSEKKMPASTSWRRTGCSVSSEASSGVRHASSIAVPARAARYSGSDRPACRMNHTGRRAGRPPE
jgi:hypothetical protein